MVDWDKDVINGVIKSFVFVLVVIWIVIFKGYDLIFIFEGIS